MALTEKTADLMRKQDASVRTHLVKSILSLVTGFSYDPAAEQAKLLRVLDEVTATEDFKMLQVVADLTALVQTGARAARDYVAEARELIRALYPIDGQQDPGPVGSEHIDGEPGNDKTDRADPYAMLEREAKHEAYSKVAGTDPRGSEAEETREVTELVAAIEKDSGSKLSAAEVVEVTKLLRRALVTGVPRTFRREGHSGGYLIMPAKIPPEDVSGDVLSLILGLGLGARR